MPYRYGGYAQAEVLARRLTNLAEQHAEQVADIQAARDEAISAVADQIRAQREVEDDRALVRAEAQHARDRRLAR